MKPMKVYYIESFSSWYIIKAQNARMAKSDGVRAYGRGMVKLVREASDEEIKYFIHLKGEIGCAG
jgi:hypothetical protein